MPLLTGRGGGFRFRGRACLGFNVLAFLDDGFLSDGRAVVSRNLLGLSGTREPSSGDRGSPFEAARLSTVTGEHTL